MARKLPIILTPKQKEVDASPARFKLLKWGRRTGKTWYIAFWIVRNAMRTPGKHWYVTKTLSLGREELWPVLLHLLPSDLLAKTDERLLSIRLTNGSIISIKSGEKEDNLRGRGLASVVLDEAAFLKERLWDQILRPQLAGSRGPALIASSPKKGWFTRLFNEVAKTTDENWLASHATIYDNPTISREEIEVIKAKTPDSTWRQEYLAEELANVGQVYNEFSSRNIYNPSKMFLDHKSYPTVLGIDYGIADPTGAAWIGINPNGFLVISAIHVKQSWDVARHASAITSRSAGYQNIAAKVLDRSAFRKEATSMTSISDLLAKEGIRCQPSEKDVQASLDIVKRFIAGDSEKPWFYVSSECEELITALQEWEHGDHEPDIAAGARYGIVWAVIKKMTVLADHFPTRIRPEREDHRFTDAQLLAMGKAPRPKARASGFSWDFEAGAFA